MESEDYIMLRNKQIWNLMGLILGVLLIITGIVFATNPPDSLSTDTAEYASFGADFYTYQYKATRYAASNAAATAYNVRELGKAEAKYVGFLFIAAGALTVVSYGKKYFTELPEVPAPVVPENITYDPSLPDLPETPAE